MTRRAFTLIELLTVIAITAVLMTLIVYPVFQSFNLVRAAQSFADAQDKARLLTERIAREVGNATSVRDTNYEVTTSVAGNNVPVPGHATVIQLPSDDAANPYEVVLPYTKLDLVLAAQGDPGARRNGAYVDPATGKADPTLKAPKGQVNVPVAPGQAMVRYYLARRDPFLPYNNPYDGLLMVANAQRDNLYVLYRAEFVPYVYRLNKNGDVGSEAMRPNLEFFESDATDTQIVGMDDPRFMIPDGTAAKEQRIRNWLAKSVNQLEISRFDAILPIFDRRTRKVEMVAGRPRVVPLVQFRPALVSNEPARGQTAVRSGDESENAQAIGPDVYQTRYGDWSRAIVRTYPAGFRPGDPYEIGFGGAGFGIFEATIGAGGIDAPGCFMLFDLGAYNAALATGTRYPFTQAALSADAYDRTNSCPSASWLDQPRLRALFTPYGINARQGKIVASFGIDEVGTTALSGGDPNRPNLPLAPTGAEVSPIQDPAPDAPYAPVTAAGAREANYSINRAFNRVWTENPNLQPNVHRFLDLRVVPNEDGTLSPLFPNYIPGAVTGMSRARIVPGSEVVYAPDQSPGPNYGQPVRYVRVTGAPGPNQYRINYVDLPEPTNAAGEVDYTVIGMQRQTPPASYDPSDPLSAVVQPRYRAGYLQFNSDPNVPLPQGEIKVSYRFQFTGGQRGAAGATSSDVFTIDYDTRQLMNVLLTVRNYPQSNLPNPQTVTLKATAAVRNVIR